MGTCFTCKYNFAKICHNKKSFYWFKYIDEDKRCKYYEFYKLSEFDNERDPLTKDDFF